MPELHQCQANLPTLPAQLPVGLKYLFIGESYHPKVLTSGLICSDETGKLLPTMRNLERLLQRFNLTLAEVGITNIAKSVLTNRNQIMTCGQLGWPQVKQEIEVAQPPWILPFGLATKAVLEKVLSQRLTIGEVDQITIHSNKYNVLPLYHPSPINPHGMAKNSKILMRHAVELNLVLTAKSVVTTVD